jgi:hypothetical protein
VQISAAQLGRLDPADDSLESKARVVEDDLDRLDAFGGSLRYKTTAADELGQIRAQSGMQMRAETCDEAATLAWREAESRIRSDGKLDATADDLAVAARVRPVVVPRRQRGPSRGGRSENGGLDDPSTPITSRTGLLGLRGR